MYAIRNEALKKKQNIIVCVQLNLKPFAKDTADSNLTSLVNIYTFHSPSSSIFSAAPMTLGICAMIMSFDNVVKECRMLTVEGIGDVLRSTEFEELYISAKL